MTLLRRLVLLVVALLCLPAMAAAAEGKSFAVAPFTVHGPDKYQYLGQGVQSMLESRLTWPNHLGPMDKAKVAASLPKGPASEVAAKKALTDLGADYLVYGAMTISGEQASIDIVVLSRDGKKWPKTVSTKISDLIPAMERASQDLNNEIFQRPAAPAGKGGSGETINQLNPDFVVNQTSENQKVYLNPNFRYAGPTETAGVWRSQSLPLVSSGIAIGNFNGDGQNLLAILGKASVEIDLDFFKEVNDAFGHEVGDAVLATVAGRLTGCVRRTDTVARLGGDEFVALTPAIGDARNACEIAEKMVTAMREPIPVLGHVCRVGASVGLALFPDHARGGEALIRLADAAMYTAKKSGRNGWHLTVSSA